MPKEIPKSLWLQDKWCKQNCDIVCYQNVFLSDINKVFSKLDIYSEDVFVHEKSS